MDHTKVIVFDLGGVLTSLGDPVTTFGFDGSENEFWEKWLTSPAVRNYESGRINSDAFLPRAIEELDSEMTTEAFGERLKNWIQVPTKGAVTLLQRLGEDYPLGLLSNTNKSHWDTVSSRKEFDKLFLSYETGLLKPDRIAFEQLPEAFGCYPDSILYSDDNQMNVTGALETGIEAVRARGLKTTSAMLAEFGILRKYGQI